MLPGSCKQGQASRTPGITKTDNGPVQPVPKRLQPINDLLLEHEEYHYEGYGDSKYREAHWVHVRMRHEVRAQSGDGYRYVPSESLLMHSRHSVFFFPVGFHIDPSNIPVSLGVGLGVRTTACRSTSRNSPSSCTDESGAGMSEEEFLGAYMLGVGALRNVDGCGWACDLEGPHPAGALLSIADDVSACGSNRRRDARRHMGQHGLSLDAFPAMFEMRCVVTNVFVGMSR